VKATLIALLLALALASGQYLETTIALPSGAMELLWNPTSNKIYTLNGDDHSVTIISGATNEVIATLPLPACPTDFVFCSSRDRVYVTCADSDSLYAIDGASDAIVARVRVDGGPSEIAYSETSNKLYVACDNSGLLAAVDCATDSVMRSIAVSGGPITVFWHPASNRLLCTTYADSICAIDCVTDSVVCSLYSGGSWWSWCYNTVSRLASIGGASGVLTLTPFGDSVAAFVPGRTSLLCAVPFENKLYLDGWHYREQVGVLDCSMNAVVDSVGHCAGPLVCDNMRGKVFCAYSGTAESLGVIDARTNMMIKTIPCTGSRTSLCLNSIDSRVYAATQSGWVYVIRDTTAGAVSEVPAVVWSSRCGASVTTGRFAWSGACTGAVINASGRRVAVVRQGANDIGFLAPGVYMVADAKGRVATRFVVVR
jgi:YVTN family beta-propeller protein